MRFIYCLFFLFLSSCGLQNLPSLLSTPLPSSPPHKEIKEIIYVGIYDKDKEDSIYEKNYSPDESSNIISFLNYNYCYQEKPKKLIIDKSIRFRLYDSKGNMLSEDFLRRYSAGNYIISYVPYKDIRDGRLKFVKIKDNGEEKVIKDVDSCCEKHEDLFHKGHRNEDILRRRGQIKAGWIYNKISECYFSIGNVLKK